MSYSKVQSSVVGNLPDIAKVKGRPRGQRSTPRSNQGRPRGQIKVDPKVEGRPRGPRGRRSKVDPEVKDRPRGRRSTPRPASQDLRRQQGRTGKSTSTPLRPDRCTCTVPPRRLDPRSYAASLSSCHPKRRAAVRVSMPCMHSVGTNRPIRVLVLFRFVSFYCRCLRRHSSVDPSSVRGPPEGRSQGLVPMDALWQCCGGSSLASGREMSGAAYNQRRGASVAKRILRRRYLL
jgi:hypothetical protein